MAVKAAVHTLLSILLAGLIISLQGCVDSLTTSDSPDIQVDAVSESPEDLDASMDDAELLDSMPSPSPVDAEVDLPAPTPRFVPLYDGATPLNPPLQLETEEALITRFADRARDRHAREDEFRAYDHYLSFYWEHRTVAVEIVDTVPKGGTTITFNVETCQMDRSVIVRTLPHLGVLTLENLGLPEAIPDFGFMMSNYSAIRHQR